MTIICHFVNRMHFKCEIKPKPCNEIDLKGEIFVKKEIFFIYKPGSWKSNLNLAHPSNKSHKVINFGLKTKFLVTCAIIIINFRVEHYQIRTVSEGGGCCSPTSKSMNICFTQFLTREFPKDKETFKIQSIFPLKNSWNTSSVCFHHR